MERNRAIKIGSPSEFTDMSAIRAAIAEFVGLFIFNFVSCGAVIVTGFYYGSGPTTDQNAKILAIAVAHGLAIGIAVSATAATSGGHINPAVTLGFLVTGRITLFRSIMYWIAQFLGAICGSGIIAGIAPDAVEGKLGTHLINKGIADFTIPGRKLQISVGCGLLVEIVITFILLFVIFGSAVDSKGPTAIAPLMIGLTILANHLAAVPLTGASMNPARSFGAVVFSKKWDDHWIYWVGPFMGAALAALLYEYVLLAPPPQTDDSEFPKRRFESPHKSDKGTPV